LISFYQELESDHVACQDPAHECGVFSVL
jgi:hypothetical protein